MDKPFDIAADLDTPVSAYLKLKPLQPRFLLESVEGGTYLSRYSFLGLGDVMKIEIRDNTFFINEEAVEELGDSHDLLTCFRQALVDVPELKPAAEGVPFTGGLVGFGSYDLVRFFERLPKSQHQVTTTEHPDGCYIAPESLLIFDHLTRRIALLHVSGEDQRSQLKDKIIELLRGPIPYSDEQHAFTAPEPNITDSEYYQAVEKAKNLIREGDIYQLVLSIKFRGSCHLDPFQAYRAMRLLNPSPYMFYFDVGNFQVVGSSPEALVRLNGTQASLRPIAGPHTKQ